jgi:hypothetical protein
MPKPEAPWAHAVKPRSNALPNRIEIRWLWWQPWVLLKLRVPKDGPVMAEMKRRHREAILVCRYARLPWGLITKHALDAPLLEESKRREKITQIKREYREMIVCHSTKKQSRTSLSAASK